jgi:hypothetical protein
VSFGKAKFFHLFIFLKLWLFAKMCLESFIIEILIKFGTMSKLIKFEENFTRGHIWG